MTSCDLSRFFQQYQDQVLAGSKEILKFEPGFVELESLYLLTDSLSVELGSARFSDSVCIDHVVFRGERGAYQNLGLCLMSYLLGRHEDILVLNLTASDSQIDRLELGHFGMLPADMPVGGLREKSIAYEYFPEALEFLPCRHNGLDELRPKAEVVSGDLNDPYGPRTTLRGFGEPRALAAFSALLLDFGSNTNEVSEVELRAFPSNYSVKASSAEIALLLPESSFF